MRIFQQIFRLYLNKRLRCASNRKYNVYGKKKNSKTLDSHCFAIYFILKFYSIRWSLISYAHQSFTLVTKRRSINKSNVPIHVHITLVLRIQFPLSIPTNAFSKIFRYCYSLLVLKFFSFNFFTIYVLKKSFSYRSDL